MKKLFFCMLLLFTFSVSAYCADNVTANYKFIIPEEGTGGWLEKISNDITSIDDVLNMLSDDLGVTSTKIKISDDATKTVGGQVGRFRFISDDGSVCYIKVYAGE